MKKMKNIIDYLEIHFDEFTLTQKRLAEFILSNSDEVPFFTADDLAAKTNTTSSSVVRFAKGIGYSGYPDLQKDLRKLIIDKINIVGQLEKAKHYIPSDNKSVIDASLKKDLDNINQLIKMKDDKDIEEFVKLIIASRKKYILACRTSFSLGHFLFYKTKKIISDIFLLNNCDQSIFDILRELNSEDLIVAISFPRFTKLTIDFTQYAKNTGAKVISITNSKISPLYKISDVCLLCPYKGSTFFNSNVAAMALINTIVSKIFSLNYELAISNLKKEDSILLKHDIWYKQKNRKL